MELSRQEYWSRLPFPTPGDLPDSGLKLVSLASPALAGGFFITSATWDFTESSVGKESPYNVGDLGLIPGVGRSPGEGNSYPLQYSGPGEFHGL